MNLGVVLYHLLRRRNGIPGERPAALLEARTQQVVVVLLRPRVALVLGTRVVERLDYPHQQLVLGLLLDVPTPHPRVVAGNSVVLSPSSRRTDPALCRVGLRLSIQRNKPVWGEVEASVGAVLRRDRLSVIPTKPWLRF